MSFQTFPNRFDERHLCMNIKERIDFGNYPFYVGVRRPEDFKGIPASLPFNIYIDHDTALPALEITPEIKDALSHAYGQGSMLSTPLGVGGLGQSRMEEFIDNFVSYFGGLAGKKIIEIGCGEGHLLARLKALGADVMGLEIGPQGKKAEENYGVRVIDRPLETVSLEMSFDAIISYGCLEHILDIKSFVKQCHALLNRDGVMFHSVPNTENTFHCFRFDDLCHQHVNYFSPQNANRFLLQNCFEQLVCKPTKAGNEMYLMAKASSASNCASPVSVADVAIATKEWKRFAEHLGNLKENFKRNLTGLMGRGRVGIYGGGHILTQMTGMGSLVDYYDGDPFKHGLSWLAGLPQIRSPHTLLKEPVSYLFIGPEHHMESISSYLWSEVGIPESIKLKRISELYKS